MCVKADESALSKTACFEKFCSQLSGFHSIYNLNRS